MNLIRLLRVIGMLCLAGSAFGREWAPASIGNLVFHGTVVSGSGSFARTGEYAIAYGPAGTSELVEPAQARGMRKSHYTYVRTGPSKAVVYETFEDPNYPRLQMETVLTFTGPGRGTAIARYPLANLGRQTIRFHVSAVAEAGPANDRAAAEPGEAASVRAAPDASADVAPAPDEPQTWIWRYARYQALYFHRHYDQARGGFETLMREKAEEAKEVFGRPDGVLVIRAFLACVRGQDNNRVAAYHLSMAEHIWSMPEIIHRAILAFNAGDKATGEAMLKEAWSRKDIEPDYQVFMNMMVEEGWIDPSRGDANETPLLAAIRASKSVAETTKIIAISLGAPAAEPAPDAGETDPIAAGWHRLAGLMTFQYTDNQWKTRKPISERLFLPYAANHWSNENAGKIIADQMEQYDQLAESPDATLAFAATEARKLFRARLQLALGNNQLGNTPDTSLRSGYELFGKAAQYVASSAADYEEARQALQDQYPNYRVIVTDVPESEETRANFNAFIDKAVNLIGDAQESAMVTGLLNWADMAEVDRAANWWDSYVIPFARRTSGPPVPKVLLAFNPVWRQLTWDKSQRADNFVFQNISGGALHHVVVRLELQNPWGDKAVQFYYFAELQPQVVRQVMPTPRWDKHPVGLLDFTNSINVRLSVWSVEGCRLDDTGTVSNPAPDTDPETHRQYYVEQENLYEAQGRILGMIVKNMSFASPDPVRMRRVLIQATTTGRSYAFLGHDEGGKARRVLLRFKKSPGEKDSYTAELRDAADGKSIRADQPTHVGTLVEDADAGPVIKFESGWRFFVGADDQPKIQASNGSPMSELIGGKAVLVFPALAEPITVSATSMGSGSPPVVNLPKEKVLLVDLPYVFDHAAETQAFRAKIKQSTADADEILKKYKDEGNAMVSQYKDIDAEMKTAADDRQPALLAAKKDIYDRILAQQKLIKNFADTTTTQLKQRQDAYQTAYLGTILQVIATYQKDNGFAVAYDTNTAKIGFGLPLLPPGVDGEVKTQPIVEMLDQRRE